MAKKTKNPKLSKPMALAANKIKKSTGSAFAKHAEKLVQRKIKNREKKKDAVDRMMKEMKKNNKMATTRIAKNQKKSKFDLDGDDIVDYKLTHKGMDIQQIDDFDQAGLVSDQELNQQYVQNAHFDGFQDQNEGKPENKHKTKKQVYEQIMAKSKLYKQAKQRQLEQNFEAAVELDEEFPDFVRNLKFMTKRDGKVDQQRNYQKMLNELRQQPKAICQKLIKPDVKKQQSKKKLKRMQLIKKLQDQDQEQDIRGWIKGVNAQSEQDEDEYDQLDDVNLSGEDDQDDQDDEDNEDDQQDDQQDDQEQNQYQDQDQDQQQDQQN